MASPYPAQRGLRHIACLIVGTLRLELSDPTLREWEATVLAADADGVVLDRSAFYPGGGGQPPDSGVLLWGGVQTRIAGARKTGDDVYLLPAEGEPLPPAGTAVRGAVDDPRRSALMRTHSALHLLNGVVYRDFGLLVTSAGMEPLEGRMDFDLPDVPDGFRDRVQEACNAEIDADRSIVVRSMSRDDAFAIEQVARAARDLVPAELREVRIVEIVGLDVEADGGTHVASTRQIGRIDIVKVENKGKGFRRLRIRLPQ
jgi:misacylated tRNA(Ala) deacylase